MSANKRKSNAENPFGNTAKSIVFVALGTLTLSFSTAIFILPFNLVTGGMSSVGIILSRLFPNFISTEGGIAIASWTLFFLGLLVLGKAFALKTLLSTIIYPLFVAVFSRLCDPSVLGGFFYLPAHPHIELAMLLSALFGGLFVGLGCLLTFMGGGSTGGVDIVVLIALKLFGRLNGSVLFFAIDALTVALGAFVVGDLVLTLLGILSAFVCAYTISTLGWGNGGDEGRRATFWKKSPKNFS